MKRAFSRMRPLLAAVALAALVLFSSCGAYFNTYYNASRAYRKGEKTLAGSGAKTARPDYDECLKISSKLLQFYPNSRWVDDTILLIGQCYVRLDQHHRALRKFDELEAGYPSSPLLATARIWRAKAFLALDRRDDCLKELARMDLDLLERGDRVEALRIYADLYRLDHSQERLLEIQERLLKTTRRNQDRAAIHLDMAATLERSGQWEEALKHFNAVRRFRPAHALLFRSWLGNLDNNLRLGNLDVVKRRLTKLRKDERFYADRHALDLREGWLIELHRDLPRAKTVWAEILREFPRTESSAAASYALGRVFLFEEEELDSARTYFKRTAAEHAGGGWADSSAQATLLLESLDKTRKEIRRLEDLLANRSAMLNPDSVRLTAARAYLPGLRASRDSTRAAAVADSAESAAESQPLARSSLDSLSRRVAEPEAGPRRNEPRSEAAVKDSLETQRESARKGGRVRLFDFQRKERDVVRADSLRAAQLADSLVQAADKARRDRLDSVLVAAVLDTLSRTPVIDSLGILADCDSLGSLRFEQRFYLAEIQSLRLKRPLRADSLMRQLLQDPQATPEQAARLHYAYGMLRLEQLDDSSGRGWLRRLVETWPLALSANAARDRLGLPRAMTLEDSAAVLLLEAENTWQKDHDPLAAMRDYLAIADAYPTAPQAATALLAAATIAWDDLENPALGVEHFRLVLKDFPDHPAADQIRRRLGQAVAAPVEQKPATEEENQVVDAAEARTDESGAFLDPDRAETLTVRLQTFRGRFRELGRLRLEQVLE